MILFATLRRRRRAGASLARPNAPEVTFEPGIMDGEVDLIVTDLPDTWGDASVPGDGLGTPGILEWWNPVDGWQELADPADTGTYIVDSPPELWGTLSGFAVRGISAEGRAGVAASGEVSVPGEQQTLDLLYVSSPDNIVTNSLDGGVEQMTVYIPT